MNVHDAVFAIGGVVNAAALIPALVCGARFPRWTSFPTAATLTAFAANFATLGFWWTAVVTSFTATAWWIIYARGDVVLPDGVHVHLELDQKEIADAVLRERL